MLGHLSCIFLHQRNGHQMNEDITVYANHRNIRAPWSLQLLPVHSDCVQQPTEYRAMFTIIIQSTQFWYKHTMAAIGQTNPGVFTPELCPLKLSYNMILQYNISNTGRLFQSMMQTIQSFWWKFMHLQTCRLANKQPLHINNFSSKSL